MNRNLRPLFLILAIALFGAPWAPAGLAAAPPSTGENTSQTIHIEPGWNWVSMHVLPQNSAFETIFGEVLDQIEMIKDGSGRVFAPDLGVAEIEAWDWRQAYAIRARVATTVTVSGALILPGQSNVPLEAGWNFVPFLPTAPLAVEAALAGILPFVEAVRDVDDRMFVPGQGVSDLDSLRAGQGFMIRLAQPVMLYYPGASGDILTVPNLAAALALADLDVGQMIEVQGYHTPGDGGGGTFRVDNSGKVPDGGLVFVPNQYLSPEVVVPRMYNAAVTHVGVPAGEHVVFGSLTLEVLDRNTEEVLLSAPGEVLHGHQFTNTEVHQPRFFYGQGRFHDYTHAVYRFHERRGEPGWGGRLRFTYRHTTAPVRLVRQGVGSSLNIRWFGARSHDEDATINNQPIIAQALNVARMMNDPQFGGNPGTITEVLIPGATTGGTVYEYFGALELPADVALRGQAGTELVTVTNDLGHTYQPVRVADGHTRLRVKANEALTFIRMAKPASDPHHVPMDAMYFFETRQSGIFPQNHAMRVTVENLVLDGHYEQNQQAWDEGWATHEELEHHLRNAPGWAGISASNHGRIIPQGQHLTVRNVAVLGYGSTGLLGNVNNVWSLENVRLGNAVWNHVLYSVHNYDHTGVDPSVGGFARNITLEGFAWTHVDFYAGRVENLVLEDAAISPRRPSGRLFNIRGGDVYSAEEFVGTDSGEYVRSDGTVLPLGVVVDGFYIDARGSAMNSPFSGIGPGIVIRNGTYVQSESVGGGNFFVENGNGWQRALYPDYLFEDVTVYRWTSGDNPGLFGLMHVTNSTFRNFTTVNASGAAYTGAPIEMTAYRRDHPAWDQHQFAEFRDITETAPSAFVLKTTVHPEAAGRTIAIRNSAFNNSTNGVVVGLNHQGTLGSIDADLDLLSVIWDSVELRLHDEHLHNLELFFRTGRMRDVADLNSGRTSEDAGTHTFTASGGETWVEIATNLLWEPEWVDVQEGEGASGLIGTVSVTNVSGADKRQPRLRVDFTRPLTAGETVTLAYDAAVRPLAD
jgi:hypothetical protein